MTTQEFIFSRKRNLILLRHSTFWFLWICYFAVQTMTWRWGMMPVPKVIGFAFFTVVSTTWADMTYCYLIIYFLLPKFFFKGHFLKFFIGWLCWTIIVSICFRFVSVAALQLARTVFHLPQRPPQTFIIVFFSNFGLFGFEGCIAAAIVLGKNWYFNNQSLLALKSNRKESSHLLRAQQHLLLPFAIVRYQLKQLMAKQPVAAEQASNSTGNTAASQQSIEETLSLTDQIMDHAQFTRIPLTSELNMVEQYLHAKQQEFPRLSFSIDKGLPDVYIFPNLLLSLTYIPFAALQNEEGSDFRLTVTMKETNLFYEFSWKGTDPFSLPESGQYDGLKSLDKLLNFYYSGNFSLTMEKTIDGMFLHFQVTLKKEIA